MIYIKEILKIKGITINEVAAALGVSRQALSKQINGNMQIVTAQKIADVLNVPLYALFKDPTNQDGDRPAVGCNELVITCPVCGASIDIDIDIDIKAREE